MTVDVRPIRKIRPRDSQRSKVYRAEGSIHDKCERLESLPEIQAWVDKITMSRWFRNRWPDVVHQVMVKDGRARRRGCMQGYWDGTWFVCWIKLPRWTRNKLYILHELAHAVTKSESRYKPVPWHGREFCRNYIQLVSRWISKDVAWDLRLAFQRHNVKYMKKWPPRRKK